jgi:hypothetical protein
VRLSHRILHALGLSFAVACGTDAGKDASSGPSDEVARASDPRAEVTGVFLLLADDVEAPVRARIAELLSKATGGRAAVVTAAALPVNELTATSLVVSIGAYALLEELGFAFLHPLAPVVPRSLRVPDVAIDRRETPRWDMRETHLHTQHPLELTELLQGFGESGPLDAAGFQRMLPEVA